MSETVPTADEFRERYQSDQTPWAIGRPQPAIVRAADRIDGKVLDVGCGTGELSLFLAERGHLTLGVDAEEAAIEQARHAKAARGGELPVEFQTHDALDLAGLNNRFDTVVDCLLFHCFDDEQRIRYVSGLRQVLRPGGTLLLLVFSDQEPPGDGPRRIAAVDLATSFARGFVCRDLEAVPIEVREADQAMFSDYGPKGWLAVYERLDDGVLAS